jgi:dihydropteroate synthase
MGILNCTPDSFYDGGKFNNPKAIVLQVEKMLHEGATFIDVGAYSSRPGATNISVKEELSRIVPIVELLVKTFDNILISVDTFRSTVAKNCIKAGACMVNDIAAGELDKNMFKTIGKLQVPYIAMHMQGKPQTMQSKPQYQNVTQELIYYFSKKLNELRSFGVNDVLIDVGFGFGKTIDHNYELLNNLALFKNLDAPVLVGLSRKSMLYKPLNLKPETALNATIAAQTIALLKGANILRVHDVKEAVETIKIVELLQK